LTFKDRVFLGKKIQKLHFSLKMVDSNEMAQGPCAHLQLHETSTVVLDRLNVIIDRLNVICSGSAVYMKTDAKVCYQGDHLVAIFEV
jgi:hypothetical protein